MSVPLSAPTDLSSVETRLQSGRSWVRVPTKTKHFLFPQAFVPSLATIHPTIQ